MIMPCRLRLPDFFALVQSSEENVHLASQHKGACLSVNVSGMCVL